MQIKSNNDLLAFIISQSNSGDRNWFGFAQQKIAGINTAYEMAVLHGDKMTPDEIVNYVLDLNNKIFNKIIKGEQIG
jgi:hypothetical protein